MKFLTILVSTFFISVYSHGAQSVPPSRQWQCSGGASPNLGVGWNGRNGIEVCQPSNHVGNINNVITMWAAVAQTPDARTTRPNYDENNPRQIHVDGMGDGLNSKICSANRESYSALDEVIWTEDLDNAYPFRMDPGVQLFEYKSSAPHRTFGKGYFHVYITKDGWNRAIEPTWHSLEIIPFCKYAGDPAGAQVTDTWSCDVPVKSGSHIMYTVWQRDDSAEVFYSCSDVKFNGKNTATDAQTGDPTDEATDASTDTPTVTPTDAPTDAPTNAPTNAPTDPPGLTTDSPHTKYNLFQDNVIKFGNKCVATTSLNRLTTSTCAPRYNKQKFFNSLDYQIRNKFNLCWDIDSSRGLQYVNLVLCENYKKSQMFSYDSETGILHPSENNDYCVTTVGPYLASLPCRSLVEVDGSIFGIKL